MDMNFPNEIRLFCTLVTLYAAFSAGGLLLVMAFGVVMFAAGRLCERYFAARRGPSTRA